MRGDEVDGGVRLAAVIGVQVGRPAEAVREVRRLAALPLPETPDAVPVARVPFAPARGKVADLVAALAKVPGLGDQLHLADHRVLPDDVEEAPEPIHVVQLPSQRRCQVEAEAIHVHLGDPVAQAVHDQLQDARLGRVQRVAGAGVVHVAPLLVHDQPVVRGVVDAPEAECRPALVALAGVVVDHVEDHLDPGAV